MNYLSNEGRLAIQKFLQDKSNKQVITCSRGFIDLTEGVPVSDATAIRWAEEEGAVFSVIFPEG
jgi:hypothetical protein